MAFHAARFGPLSLHGLGFPMTDRDAGGNVSRQARGRLLRGLTLGTALGLGLLPVGLATLPAQAQMITITPDQIGQIFCIGSLGNDMAPVEALLTPDLAAAVAELGRYVPERIVLGPAVASDLPVSAIFSTREALSAVQALAKTQGLTARRIPGVAIIIA